MLKMNPEDVAKKISDGAKPIVNTLEVLVNTLSNSSSLSNSKNPEQAQKCFLAGKNLLEKLNHTLTDYYASTKSTGIGSTR